MPFHSGTGGGALRAKPVRPTVRWSILEVGPTSAPDFTRSNRLRQIRSVRAGLGFLKTRRCVALPSQADLLFCSRSCINNLDKLFGSPAGSTASTPTRPSTAATARSSQSALVTTLVADIIEYKVLSIRALSAVDHTGSTPIASATEQSTASPQQQLECLVIDYSAPALVSQDIAGTVTVGSQPFIIAVKSRLEFLKSVPIVAAASGPIMPNAFPAVIAAFAGTSCCSRARI